MRNAGCMMKCPENLPQDLNAEILLNDYPEGSLKVTLAGSHKRNAYGDLIRLEAAEGQTPLLALGRNSLYNSLPECLFHSIDLFGNLPADDRKRRFSEACEQLEQEQRDALRFFEPMDLLLLKTRLNVRRGIEEYAADNKVLRDLIGDSLTEKQQGNRLIARASEFLPFCKFIRGDRFLITSMLRKILRKEGIALEVQQVCKTCSDAEPRYGERVGACLDDLYVGCVFPETVTVYRLRCWFEEECNERFPQFVDDMETFRAFLQDYFFSVEELLVFDLYDGGSTLRLPDADMYNYLGYNTNI